MTSMTAIHTAPPVGSRRQGRKSLLCPLWHIL